MFCFIKKSHKSKKGHPPSYFFKEQCEIKYIKMYVHNMYSTNIKGRKKNWVPKLDKSNFDADDDTDSCPSSYRTEEINMLYRSTLRREEIYNKKAKSLNL